MKVAIIGAGTCGLYLAWKLSKAGHKVRVFEKKKTIAEVGQKSCSFLISERLKDFIPIDTSLIENKIDFCSIHFPKKTITLNIKPTHLAINRQKLIETLFGLVKGSGAEILFDNEIKNAPSDFDRIIGCDGALSKTREQLNLSRPLFRLGLQVFEEKKDNSNFVETWPINQGFCWKIPRGEQTEYGAIGPLQSVKKDFKKFFQTQQLIEKSSRLIEKGALVPQGLRLPKQGNVTLCGDAAGLTKPWSGGGVIWGLQAADILIKHFPDFRAYHQEASRVFKKRFLKGKLALPLVYFLGRHLPFVLPSRVSIDNDFLKI